MRKSVLFAFGLVTAALVALGLIVLSSASLSNASRLLHNPYGFIYKQFVYVGVGIVVAVCAAFFDYRRLRDHWILTAVLYGVVLALLLIVLKCKVINGSRRWIELGFFNVQPSEIAKLVVVIALGVWLDRIAWRVELFRQGALYPSLIIAFLCAPILVQPDFGSMMVVAAVGGLLMFVAGVRWRYLLFFGALGGLAFVSRLLANGNRMARIAAFFGIKLNVGVEVADAAAERATYQVNQALVAIKNGGIFGVGLGNSMQKHSYLPEAHTDFIFAVGAEEMGLIFSLAVLLLFLAFFLLSVHIARHAADRFGRFLVIGMSFIIFFQAMFNLGVVCKALPTKGMALPFFSYGGTNMLCAFAEVGIILSVGIHSYRVRKRGAVAPVR